MYTQTSINSVYYTRLYHEYRRIEAEAGKEAGVKMLEANETALNDMLGAMGGDLQWILNDKGYGKEAKEMERHIELVTVPLNGVRELWSAAVVSESIAEFRTLIAAGPLPVDI